MKKALIMILPIVLFAACSGEETPRDKFIAQANELCMFYYANSEHASDYTTYCKCLGVALSEHFSDAEIDQFLAGTLDLKNKKVASTFATECAPMMPGVR